MSKGYQNWASEVAYFIGFNFTVFAMFKTLVLLIAGDCLKLDLRNVLWDDLGMYDDLFNKLKKTNEFITKEQIYALYEQVLNEIKSGKQDAGVWAKAYADARGDLQVQKALYIELMVERYVLAGEAEQEAINLNKKKEKRKAFKEKMDKATETVKEVHREVTKPTPVLDAVVFLLIIVLILVGVFSL